MAVSAAVIAALVLRTVIVMAALEIRIDAEFALQEGSDYLIHIACCAADQLDSGFRQRHLRSAADAAAEE